MTTWKKMLVSLCLSAVIGVGVGHTIVPSVKAVNTKWGGNVATSYHAKDRMKERGVTSKEIKQACVSGDKFYDTLHNNYVYYYKITGVFVSVTNGTMTTVIRKEKNMDLSKQGRYTKVQNMDGDLVRIG